jgi:regulatory protein
VRLLAAREHSRAELRQKLRARGHDDADIDAVLDQLARRRLLSEERMAEAYVSERLRKGFGPLRVREELRRKGLADAVIEPHLSLSNGVLLEHLAAAAEKKFGTGPAGDRKELGRRARFLEYRGFPPALIARYLGGEEPD